MNRLNLGCGPVLAVDWINVDREPFGQTHVVDLRDGLPFPDDYFDYIVANHSLQILTYNEHAAALAELRRVLKPGGVLRVLVPDLARVLDAYDISDRAYFPIADDLERTLSGKLARYLHWHGETRATFDDGSLIDLLERNGFTAVVCDYGKTRSKYAGITELDSRERESLIVEATR